MVLDPKPGDLLCWSIIDDPALFYLLISPLPNGDWNTIHYLRYRTAPSRQWLTVVTADNIHEMVRFL